MRLTLIFVLSHLLSGIGSPTLPSGSLGQQPSKVAISTEQLIGSWRLVSVETIRPSGEVIFPFYGQHPQGLLVYENTGWMSVQIVSDPKPEVPRSDSREGFQAAPLAEKAKAVDGYCAYFGTWIVDTAQSTVTHHIQQSLYPAERGEIGVRKASIDGDGSC